MRFLIAVLALIWLVPFGGARADQVADFYRGKTVNVWVGYGPGGGYDLSARVLARHMGRHLPGKPTLVARNMPGCGVAHPRQLALQCRSKRGA